VAKHETNAKRRAREYGRRTTLLTAKRIAETISERRKNKADLAPKGFEELPAKELKRLGWHPETKCWKETYAYLGEVLCEFCPFDENPSKFLRLIADYLDGRPLPYSPGKDWYDEKITVAYAEAVRRMPRPRLVSRGDGMSELIIKGPSFSEFEKIFCEQNPKLSKPPSKRSMRRSLKRLGYKTRPSMPGRPKQK